MSLVQHALSSGLRNFTRNIWLSITAITVLAVSLSAVGMLSLISTSLEYAIKQLDNQVSIVVFFREGSTVDDVKTVQSDVEKNFDMLPSTITDKEQEKQRLTERQPTIADAFELVGNPLSFKLELQPKSINDYDSIANFLARDDYVQIINPSSIRNPSTTIGNLKQLNNITKTTSIIVIAVFALVSILVMINILRLAVYNRREEIEIMRLVGATNGYIQSPFIVEGVLYNIIAALLVLALFIPLTNTVTPAINNYLASAFRDTTANQGSLSSQVFINLGINIIAGVVVGVLTIYTAIQRYLKK